MALVNMFRRALPRAAPAFGVRAFASGPAAGGHISDELLDKLGGLSTQALIDGLWVMGWPSSQLDDVRPLSPTMKVRAPRRRRLFWCRRARARPPARVSRVWRAGRCGGSPPPSRHPPRRADRGERQAAGADFSWMI